MLGCDLKEICERSMDIQLFSSHTNQQKLNERASTSEIDSTDSISFFEGPAFHLNVHNILKSIIPDSFRNKTMADVFKVDVVRPTLGVLRPWGSGEILSGYMQLGNTRLE